MNEVAVEEFIKFLLGSDEQKGIGAWRDYALEFFEGGSEAPKTKAQKRAIEENFRRSARAWYAKLGGTGTPNDAVEWALNAMKEADQTMAQGGPAIEPGERQGGGLFAPPDGTAGPGGRSAGAGEALAGNQNKPSPSDFSVTLPDGSRVGNDGSPRSPFAVLLECFCFEQVQ